MATLASEHRVLESGSITPEAMQLAEQRGVVRELFQIGVVTEELFPGNFLVEVHHDPEIPNYSVIVFNVVARGTVEDVVRRDNLWVERLIDIAPGRPSLFCLSLDIQV
jgi:hypothetical protein